MRPCANRAALAAFFLAVLFGAAPPAASEGRSMEFLNSGKVLPPGLPFSEAVRAGNTVYLSGQIGIVPGTGALAVGGIEAEARQTMENIRTVLEAHGLSLASLAKCTVMMADMDEWPAFNTVYASFFGDRGDRLPARSAFGANGLALGARVEVECIAIVE